VSTLPLLLLWLLPVLIAGVAGTHRWPRRPAWVGGTGYDAEQMQYTGSAFSAQIWEPIARAVDHEPPGLLPGAVRVTSRRVVVEQGNRIVNRLLRLVLRSSEGFGARVHSGDVRRYLLYIGLALSVGLLIAILYPVATP